MPADGPPGPGFRFAEIDPDAPEATWCLQQYYEELDNRFDGGFDIERSLVSDPGGALRPHGAFLIASLEGQPVACGMVTVTSPGLGYIKRMWVAPSQRGQGLGRRMLDALEGLAGELGCRRVQLETNRTLAGAISLYRASGYREVAAFNTEPYAHHWFEKTLIGHHEA